MKPVIMQIVSAVLREKSFCPGNQSQSLMYAHTSNLPSVFGHSIARPLTGGSCNYEKCQCVRFPRRTVLEGYLPIKAISVSTTACFAERSLWLVFGRIPAFPRSQGSSERGKEGNTAAF